MGVPEFKYKIDRVRRQLVPRGYGGVLFASFAGKLPPPEWNLTLSVEFIAILLIGGAGTVAGALLGSHSSSGLLPLHLEHFVHWMSEQVGEGAGSRRGPSADFFISTAGDDFGFVSDGALAPGFALPSSALLAVLYGVLIIVSLFEPRGLYGIWVKIRNYWKGWPFTY